MSRRSRLGLCLVGLLASSAPLLIGQEAKPEQSDVLAGHPGPFVKTLAEPIAPETRAQGSNFWPNPSVLRVCCDAQQTPRLTDQAGREGDERSGAITIAYDDGVLTATPAATGFSHGNQFNSASGDPVTSFSVTMLSFYLAGAGTDSVFVTVFGAVDGTTAPVLGSMLVGPIGPGLNIFTVGPYAGTGSFLAGVFFTPGATLGLGSGTVNGQGHHAMVINDIAGTGFQTLPGLNATIRATTAFIPVELMDFRVTDE